MTEDQLTALGAALERTREEAGVTKAAAARTARISRSTWDTLTRGYVVRQGQRFPVRPKLENVTAAAAAVGLDVQEAAALAGYQLTERPAVVHLDLSLISTEDLLAELGKRALPPQSG